MGYGLVWIEMAGITTPFTTPVFPFLQTVSQRTLDNITPAFTLASGPRVEPIALTPNAGLGQGVCSVDRDLGSGYVQQWNASLQRELATNVAVEGAYVGSKIRRVGLPDTNVNQLTVEQLSRNASLLQRIPNPYFGIVPRSSPLGDPTIPVAQLLKPSTHVFVASAVWDPPFGGNRGHNPRGVAGALVNDWTLTGVVTLQSGMPLAIAQTTNNNAFAGFWTQRPNLIGDPTLPASERSAGRWFNTSAFVAAPQFTLGTSTRNPVRGPSYRNLDLALMRRLPLAGTTTLEIRGEVFNALNMPPLGAPNTTVGAAAFGIISTAGDPRGGATGVEVLVFDSRAVKFGRHPLPRTTKTRSTRRQSIENDNQRRGSFLDRETSCSSVFVVSWQ